MKGRKKREGTGVCMCEVVMGAGEHNQVRGRKKREGTGMCVCVCEVVMGAGEHSQVLT